MDRVVVFGNGVFAELMCFHLTHDSPYEVSGFTVDRSYVSSRTVLGLPLVPFENVEAAFPPSEHKMIVPVSFQRMNQLRARKYRQAKDKGYELINYVSSRALTWPDLTLGENCVILESAVISPFAKIGNNVVIATSAIIGHHSTIRDHCFVSPGAIVLGGATIEEYCLIGAHATVKEEVTVSRECLVGSSVCITRNTQAKGVYLNPPPQLQAKRSDELRTWLMWPVRAKSPLEV
jgi:sugar O-acyltransferase (sialic acid O-acetyltransferase NeuD family)